MILPKKECAGTAHCSSWADEMMSDDDDLFRAVIISLWMLLTSDCLSTVYVRYKQVDDMQNTTAAQTLANSRVCSQIDNM